MSILKTKTSQNITTRALYFALMLVLSVATMAQNAKISVRAPQTVGVGQRFNVSFSVNAEPSNFKPPSFKGLNYLGGPSQSRSQSIQFINGKQSSSVDVTYTYMLSASSEGKITIGAATCVVDGKTISSNPVTITVDKSAGNRTSTTSRCLFAPQPTNRRFTKAKK